MKKILIIILSLSTTSLIVLSQFSIADLVRIAMHVDLEKTGIKLKYNHIPKGMYQKPFIIDFSNALSFLAKGEIRIKAINTYTVGNFKKDATAQIKGVSNFLDPTSKFKDAWFGVFLVHDCSENARNFMLINSKLPPGDLKNINPESILKLPGLDQKMISRSTHQRQVNYDRSGFDNDFYFIEYNGKKNRKEEIIPDKKQRKWYKITSEFITTSALTDIYITDMKLLHSIRSFVGLPNEEVYRHVKPWHEITIKGSVYVRYFECSSQPFWAIVYYNGSAFRALDGGYVDTWEKTDLKEIFQKMFESLEIECI